MKSLCVSAFRRPNAQGKKAAIILCILAERSGSMALLTITDNDAHTQHFLDGIVLVMSKTKNAKEYNSVLKNKAIKDEGKQRQDSKTQQFYPINRIWNMNI